MALLKVIGESNNRNYDLIQVFTELGQEYQTQISDESWVEIEIVFSEAIKSLESINVFIGAGAAASQPRSVEVYLGEEKIAERLAYYPEGETWYKSVEEVIPVVEGKREISSKKIKLRIQAFSNPSYPLIIPVISFIGVSVLSKYLFKDGEEFKTYHAKVDASYTEEDVTSVIQSSNVTSSSHISGNSHTLAINGNTTEFNGWLASTNKNEWLSYKFNQQRSIRKYKIAVSSSGIGLTGAPKTWRFEGSSDGVNWTQLDNKSGVTGWTNGVYKEFEIDSVKVGSYVYYRIYVLENNGSPSYVKITEMRLIESVLNTAEVLPYWENVGNTSARKELFDLHGMTDLSLITDEAIQQLQSDQVELLCWTDEVNGSIKRNVLVEGVPNGQLLVPVEDINSDELESILLTVSESEVTSDMKVVVSNDTGITWTGKNPVDINDLASVKENGFTPDELNALTKEEHASLFPEGRARFAFYLEQENVSDVVEIQSQSVGEKVYTVSPTIEDISVIYDMMEGGKPKLYASRDDGATWSEVSEDMVKSLNDQPEGNKIRVKIVLKDGQEAQAVAYSWA